MATSHTEQPPDGDELHTRSITSADELHTRSMYSAPRSLDLSSLAPRGVDSISSAPSRPESEHRRHHEEHTRSNGQGPNVAAGGSTGGSGDRATLQNHPALRALRDHPVSIGAGRRRREKQLKPGGDMHNTSEGLSSASSTGQSLRGKATNSSTNRGSISTMAHRRTSATSCPGSMTTFCPCTGHTKACMYPVRRQTTPQTRQAKP